MVVGHPSLNGVFYGNPSLLGYTLAAILVVILLSFGISLILVILLEFTIGFSKKQDGKAVTWREDRHHSLPYRFHI